MKHIVKRRGHTEQYDQRKLYASVYAACLSVRVPQGEAELVAERVAADLDKWLHDKQEVTSGDIGRNGYKSLNVYNSEAAWMYKHHRSVG